jgi:HSP20 family protein
MREIFMMTTEELCCSQNHSEDDVFEILVRSYKGRGSVPMEDELDWRPATDVYETEDSFVAQMDLAGMDPASIEVLSDGDILVVRGTRRDISLPGKKHFFTMEISVGPFARHIEIPIPVQTKTAVARYRNGFLFVSFDRGEQEPGSPRHRIEVNR